MNKKLFEEIFHVNEDFEFYKDASGTPTVDYVSTKSGSGLSFQGVGKGSSNVVKKVPFNKMPPEMRAEAKAAYKALKANGDIDEVTNEFNTTPKADVVPKADGKTANVYFDDNESGLPDETIRLAASKREGKIKEALYGHNTEYDDPTEKYYNQHDDTHERPSHTKNKDLQLALSNVFDIEDSDIVTLAKDIFDENDAGHYDWNDVDDLADAVLEVGYEDEANALWDAIADDRQGE